MYSNINQRLDQSVFAEVIAAPSSEEPTPSQCTLTQTCIYIKNKKKTKVLDKHWFQGCFIV